MTKAIILSNGVVKNMTYEEVLKQFDQMLNRFVTQAIEKIVYNKPEFEEIKQELRIQTWEAYRRYDGKHAFSTYLVPRLQHGVYRATQKMYAKKRTYKGKMTQLDESLDTKDGTKMTISELIGDEDQDMMSLPFKELMIYLEKTLDYSEQVMLKSLLDKNDFSIQDLADELGMSRQGANKKYNKFRSKMANLLRELGYVAC
jgi:RNA polymerase sigma factor (sigma-70 family)